METDNKVKSNEKYNERSPKKKSLIVRSSSN